MISHANLSRLFFGMAMFLFLAAGLAAPRAVTAQDAALQAIPPADRCPGRTLPVCQSYTQGGQTDYYYFE
jgi:hypothetical protein